MKRPTPTSPSGDTYIEHGPRMCIAPTFPRHTVDDVAVILVVMEIQGRLIVIRVVIFDGDLNSQRERETETEVR